jgi:hypothetical protein
MNDCESSLCATEIHMLKKARSRGWLLTPLLLALCSPAKASEPLRFDVYLGDKPIGEHGFRITENDNVTRVTSRASFDVDFLFSNAYRSRHDSREVFHDGCLQEIRSTTDDNGTKHRVEGKAIGGDFRIAREDGKEQANGCLMTFAYNADLGWVGLASDTGEGGRFVYRRM